MPKRIACALCGVFRYSGPGVLPEGRYTCRECRATRRAAKPAIASRTAAPRRRGNLPRLWCVDCAKPMAKGRGSLPQGKARCRECRRAARLATARRCGCGKPATGMGRFAFCDDCRRVRTHQMCEVCGEEFHPKSPMQRTCSRVCGRVINAKQRQCRIKWRFCESCKSWWVANRVGRCPRLGCRGKVKPPSCSVTYRYCRGCGRLFVAQARPRLLYCSDECQCPTRTTQERACGSCGSSFTTIFDRQRFCSEACRKREERYRRRAVQAEDVDREAVFARDRYICQLCGKRVAMTKVAPHPRSPTLDHIVPVSKGGAHEPANVQLAHFLCNSLKGNRGGGEQLRLVG